MVGTEVPESLVLVHEFALHFSLQPAREMGLSGEL